MTKENVYQFVEGQIQVYFKENGLELPVNIDSKTRLMGELLDSIELVSLIVFLEEAIEKQTNKNIILADEKAMSRRTSPFATIGYLSDYIFEKITQD